VDEEEHEKAAARTLNVPIALSSTGKTSSPGIKSRPGTISPFLKLARGGHEGLSREDGTSTSNLATQYSAMTD